MVECEIAVHRVLLRDSQDDALLRFRIDGVVRAASHHGVAAQERAFFNQNDLRAALRRGDRRGQTGSAAADNQHVGIPNLVLAGRLGVGVRLQRVGIQTGSLGSVGSRTHDGVARQRRAGYGVQRGGLMLHHQLRQTLHGDARDVGGLVAFGQLDVFDNAVFDGHGNRYGALHADGRAFIDLRRCADAGGQQHRKAQQAGEELGVFHLKQIPLNQL